MSTSIDLNGSAAVTRGRWIASRMLLIAILVVGGIAGSASPASAAPNDLVVKNGGSRTFTICKNATSETVCAGPTGTLAAGQNSKSKYGWADTDMIRIPANCKLERYGYWNASQGVIWYLYAVAGSSARWIKVPGYGGATWTFRVVC